jgi:hypothetical protein
MLGAPPASSGVALAERASTRMAVNVVSCILKYVVVFWNLTLLIKGFDLRVDGCSYSESLALLYTYATRVSSLVATNMLRTIISTYETWISPADGDIAYYWSSRNHGATSTEFSIQSEDHSDRCESRTLLACRALWCGHSMCNIVRIWKTFVV